MGTFIRLGVAAALLLFAAGCETYPYSTGFSSCDNQAGACYRDCEYYADTPDYAVCHSDCEYEADQCFADAYQPYNYAGSGYGPGYVSPWYGSYGSWYPQSGYAFSFGYSNYNGYPNSGRRYYGNGYDGRRGRRSRGRDYDGPRGDRPGRRQPRGDGTPGRSGRPQYDGPRAGGGSPSYTPRPRPTPPAGRPPSPPPTTAPPQAAPPPATPPRRRPAPAASEPPEPRSNSPRTKREVPRRPN